MMAWVAASPYRSLPQPCTDVGVMNLVDNYIKKATINEAVTNESKC